jgi:hypothetical protein
MRPAVERRSCPSIFTLPPSFLAHFCAELLWRSSLSAATMTRSPLFGDLLLAALRRAASFALSENRAFPVLYR